MKKINRNYANYYIKVLIFPMKFKQMLKLSILRNQDNVIGTYENGKSNPSGKYHGANRLKHDFLL